PPPTGSLFFRPTSWFSDHHPPPARQPRNPGERTHRHPSSAELEAAPAAPRAVRPPPPQQGSSPPITPAGAVTAGGRHEPAQAPSQSVSDALSSTRPVPVPVPAAVPVPIAPSVPIAARAAVPSPSAPQIPQTALDRK